MCNKTNKNFKIFRSEIIIFADDVYKSRYNNSLAKNVNFVIKRLVD